MDKKAVIFDLDGVLVDTSPYHKQAWFDLAAKLGCSITDEFFRRTFGMQNYQIIPMLVGRQLPSEEIEQLAEWKEARYRQLVGNKQILCQGVKPLLDELKETGFLLAIGTSTPRKNLDFILAQTAIRHYFDALVSGEDVRRGKPAPDTFLKAAEKLALPAHRAAVVEDAVAGIQAAKNAGMAVVAVTSTRTREELKEADIVVDSLTELKAEDFSRLIDDKSAETADSNR